MQCPQIECSAMSAPHSGTVVQCSMQCNALIALNAVPAEACMGAHTMHWSDRTGNYEDLYILINPWSEGSPYRSRGTVVKCSALNQDICPSRFYCHIGSDARTTVCCPVQGKLYLAR